MESGDPATVMVGKTGDVSPPARLLGLVGPYSRYMSRTEADPAVYVYRVLGSDEFTGTPKTMLIV